MSYRGAVTPSHQTGSKQGEFLLSRKAQHARNNRGTTLRAPSHGSVERELPAEETLSYPPPPPPPWMPPVEKHNQHYGDENRRPPSGGVPTQRAVAKPQSVTPRRTAHADDYDSFRVPQQAVECSTHHMVNWSGHPSLSTSHLARDQSLADIVREKDRLLRDCLAQKRRVEEQLHEERAATADRLRRTRLEVYNEFMHALRHGGIVAVESLGTRLQHSGGDGSSPKSLDAAGDYYVCPTTPLPHTKQNHKAREEATIRVRNALAILQQPSSGR